MEREKRITCGGTFYTFWVTVEVCCSMVSCNSFKWPSRSFTCIRVDFTVALNLSGAHEANAALGFTEVSDALLIFLVVLFIMLKALEQVSHSSFDVSSSTSMSQGTCKCHFKARLLYLNGFWHTMTNNGVSVQIWDRLYQRRLA